MTVCPRRARGDDDEGMEYCLLRCKATRVVGAEMPYIECPPFQLRTLHGARARARSTFKYTFNCYTVSP